MNGLLGGAMPQQMQQGGGLLGGGAMPQREQQGSANGLKYAQALSQNPSIDLAMQIVQALKQEGDPSAEQWEQVFSAIGDDPQKIKQIADSAVQELSEK